MRSEYGFSGGVRGKYWRRYARGTNIVVLDPDVAKCFPDSGSVNRALRALAEIAQRKRKRTTKYLPARKVTILSIHFEVRALSRKKPRTPAG